MSGTDALPSDAPSPPRPLFAGRRGGQAVTFVCSHDGTFGIWCGGACLSVWAADEVDAALRAYLVLIDAAVLRRMTLPLDQVRAPGGDAPPRKDGGGSGLASQLSPAATAASGLPRPGRGRLATERPEAAACRGATPRRLPLHVLRI